MIGPAPKREKHEWDGKEIKAGKLKAANANLAKHDKGFQLMRLPGDVSDDEKIDFERYHRRDIRILKNYYVPDMADPYYTWEGRVVERSKIEGRPLPLALK